MIDSDAPKAEGNRHYGLLVVSELGELGPGALITEVGLASMCKRHVDSIKRAIRRGELPPPTRLLGGSVWTAGALIRHIEKRLAEAAKEAEADARRLAQLGA